MRHVGLCAQLRRVSARVRFPPMPDHSATPRDPMNALTQGGRPRRFNKNPNSPGVAEWWKEIAPEVDAALSPFVDVTGAVDSTELLGGLLPTAEQMLRYFGTAEPPPSERYGLTALQAKAAVLQMTTASNRMAAGVLGVDEGAVRKWTRLPGWRQYQRAILDNSYLRLAGISHIVLLQTFLRTEDEKLRVSLAKHFLEVSGVQQVPVQQHKHDVEHRMASTPPREIQAARELDEMEVSEEAVEEGGF